MFNALLKYFLQGLLLTAPIGITAYVILTIFYALDEKIGFETPGLGILMVFGIITVLGFLGSTILAKPVFAFVDHIIMKVPGINIIHSSLKDLFNALMGEKKKFKRAVLVRLNEENNIYKLGFVTQDNLQRLGIEDKISVYVPHSYAVSGDLFIVPKKNIVEVNATTTEVMRFIVSGGVTESAGKNIVSSE